MIIYPNTVKRQGSARTGIITLCIASMIASIGAVVAYFMFKGGSNFCYIPAIFAGILSIGGLISGTIDLIKGIKGLKIMRDGYKSRCEIVHIGRSTMNNNDRKGPYMIVKYRSQSNKERYLKVMLNFHNAYHLRMGMIIECYILNEGCYVNMQEEVKILEAPEEMSIKDAITSLFKDTK